MYVKFASRTSFVLILLQIFSILSIVLDIFILRQVLGFVHLIIVPGFIVLSVLRFNGSVLEKILFSIGLSMAILMFLGLLMSALTPLVGSFSSLKNMPLIFFLSSFILDLFLLKSAKNFPSIDRFAINKFMLLRGVVLLMFPFMSIIGAVTANIWLLLIMIILIAILYGISCVNKIFSHELCIAVILMVSLSLAFHTSLISKNLLGYDVHLEAFVFKSTKFRGYWVSPGIGIQSDTARFESVLSVTILPVIFSEVLSINAEVIFKIIYPLIYALIPLILYKIYDEAGLGKFVAFLSTLFFISTPTFFGVEPLSLMRQIIGQYFLVLLIFLLVNKKMDLMNKKLLFIIFSAALVVSHYALSYFFIFIVVFCFLASRRWGHSEVLNIIPVLLVLVMNFTWYVHVADAPLIKIENDFWRIYYNFITDLSKPEARGAQVATLTKQPTNILDLMHRVTFLVRNSLIALGILTLLVRKKYKIRMNKIFYLISVISFILLVTGIVVPNFAGILQPTRFYQLMYIFLAPFTVLGCEIIINFIGKHSSISPNITRPVKNLNNLFQMILLLILLSSFLFDSGFIDHIANTYPESISLDKDRMKISDDLEIKINYYSVFTIEQDVSGAIWLSTYGKEKTVIYSDINSKYHVLNSYGTIHLEQNQHIFAYSARELRSYVYLSYVNTVENRLITERVSNTSVIEPFLSISNKVYSNGGCEIYTPSFVEGNP